jgi:tRNA (guanosine-2'-O-)-methyltransferase
MYDTCSLPEQAAQEVLFAGGFPILHRECKRCKLAFPRIDENGCIEASEQWWQALQFSER